MWSICKQWDSNRYLIRSAPWGGVCLGPNWQFTKTYVQVLHVAVYDWLSGDEARRVWTHSQDTIFPLGQFSCTSSHQPISNNYKSAEATLTNQHAYKANYLQHVIYGQRCRSRWHTYMLREAEWKANVRPPSKQNNGRTDRLPGHGDVLMLREMSRSRCLYESVWSDEYSQRKCHIGVFSCW